MLHMELGRLKKEYPALSCGAYKELLLTNRQFAFGRIKDNTCIVVAMNNDDNSAHLEFNAPVTAGNMTELLSTRQGTAQLEGNRVKIDLEPNSSKVLLLD